MRQFSKLIALRFRDELLPLVHLSWQPLKLLFTSDNIFIVDRAFAVLRVFAVSAGDFIQRRTITDVFPPLVKYIRRLQVLQTSKWLLFFALLYDVLFDVFVFYIFRYRSW